MKIDLNLPWPIEPHPSWNILDSTKLSTAQDCMRKFLLEYIFGWDLDGYNHHLVFGSAWHIFKEQMILHGFDKDAVESCYAEFEKYYRQYFSEFTDLDYEPKSPGNAKKAMLSYLRKYQNDPLKVVSLDGKPLTEISGCVPLTPDARYVIYFRMDAVVEDTRHNNAIRGLEHKTSGRDVKYYDAQWVLKMQPQTYTHVLHYIFRNIREVKGVMINATFFRKKGNDFRRIPIDRNADDMSAWLWQTTHLFQSIEWHMEQLLNSTADDTVLKAFPQNGEACTKYNRLCKFHDFCRGYSNPLKLVRKYGVPTGFKREFWDPTNVEGRETRWDVDLKKDEDDTSQREAEVQITKHKE